MKLKQVLLEAYCEDQIDFEKLKLVLGIENFAGVGDIINSILQKLVALFIVFPGEYWNMNMYKNIRLIPSLDLDTLNGIMCQAVLQRPQTYLDADVVIEAHTTRDMSERAKRIRLSSALRGVFEADLVHQEQLMVSRKWIKSEGDYLLDGLSV